MTGRGCWLCPTPRIRCPRCGPRRRRTARPVAWLRSTSAASARWCAEARPDGAPPGGPHHRGLPHPPVQGEGVREVTSSAMSVPDDLRYSPDHEWARVEDGLVRIGITDYAQDALGDVVFVQVPAVGTDVKAGERFSEVESTKSVSDIYAPITGTIVEVNSDLADEPQRMNEDPYGEGWLIVLQPADPAELDSLLDAAAYQAIVDG